MILDRHADDGVTAGFQNGRDQQKHQQGGVVQCLDHYSVQYRQVCSTTSHSVRSLPETTTIHTELTRGLSNDCEGKRCLRLLTRAYLKIATWVQLVLFIYWLQFCRRIFLDILAMTSLAGC